MENFRRQWNVDRIRYSNKNSEIFQDKKWRKWKNGFKIEEFVVWLHILGSTKIVADIEEKLVNQGEDLHTRWGISCILFTFLYQANGNHAMGPSTVGHVISEWDCKSTFNFNEIVNNQGLKQGTVCQIVRYISQFSLKLYVQFSKHFHRVVLGSVGRGYCVKDGC